MEGTKISSNTLSFEKRDSIRDHIHVIGAVQIR
jgi:hypothetical protein